MITDGSNVLALDNLSESTNSQEIGNSKNNAKELSRIKKTFTQFPCGVPLKNDCSVLEYRSNKPFLKCIFKGRNFDRFGISLQNGSFFHIEEALYLAESGCAKIVFNDQTQTFAQLYSLLQRCNVSLFKYVIYKHFVHAGYILKVADLQDSLFLAKKAREENYGLMEEGLSSNEDVLEFHYLPDYLVQFPTISTDSRFIEASGVHALSSNTQLIGNTELTISWLNSSLNQFSLLSKHKNHLNLHKYCQPWICCRPKWWPSFHSITLAKTWSSYCTLRSKLFDSRVRQRPQMQKISPSHDYDIYTTTNIKTPAYRLLIERGQFGLTDLSQLTHVYLEMPMVPLLVATGNVTSFKLSRFVMVSSLELRLEDVSLEQIKT